MLTDKKSFDPVGINLNQEIEDNSVNPCITHLDDIFSVANDQTDINHDVNSTLNDTSLNITIDNSNVSSDTGSNESNLSHIKSISQYEKNEDTSIPKKLSNSKKMKQYHPTSTALTKRHALYCKISIIIAICCTTGFSLLPMIFYYVSQIGNNAPTAPEYSHERNSSTAKVC